MGVDISGMNPIHRSQKPEYPDWNTATEAEKNAYFEASDLWENENPGDYFRSNWWGWRPIHMLCEYVNEEDELNFDMSNWGSNDGGGLNNQEDCNKLADSLQYILRTSSELELDDDRIYLNLGSWVDSENRFIGSELSAELNEQFNVGEILYGGVVGEGGKIYYPSHSCSKKHLQNFINFLRECGGFEIW